MTVIIDYLLTKDQPLSEIGFFVRDQTKQRKTEFSVSRLRRNVIIVFWMECTRISLVKKSGMIMEVHSDLR